MESGILAGYPVVDVRVVARRRLLPRGRLERDRVQGRWLDGVQGGDAAGEAEAARAGDGRRGRHARGVPRRRDGRPELAARPRRGPGAARQRAGDQGERPAREMFGYATDLRSTTQGRATFTCSSIGTRKCRSRSRARSSPPRPRNRKDGGGRQWPSRSSSAQAASQRRHDRSHRPREDDAHRGDHEGARRAGRGNTAARDFASIDNAPEERQRGITINTVARRVRDGEPPLRARRLPRARRLHQEHDHGRRPDGRRDPRRLGRRRPDAADARAHPARPPGRGAVRSSSP